MFFLSSFSPPKYRSKFPDIDPISLTYTHAALYVAAHILDCVAQFAAHILDCVEFFSLQKDCHLNSFLRGTTVREKDILPYWVCHTCHPDLVDLIPELEEVRHGTEALQALESDRTVRTSVEVETSEKEYCICLSGGG